jgi:hypothetical protein
MGEYIEPFDLKTIFLNYVIGNTLLFYYVFIIVLAWGCAYFNMSNKNFYIILAIVSLMFGAYLESAVFFVTVVIIGIFSFKVLSSITWR